MTSEKNNSSIFTSSFEEDLTIHQTGANEVLSIINVSSVSIPLFVFESFTSTLEQFLHLYLTLDIELTFVESAIKDSKALMFKNISIQSASDINDSL